MKLIKTEYGYFFEPGNLHSVLINLLKTGVEFDNRGNFKYNVYTDQYKINDREIHIDICSYWDIYFDSHTVRKFIDLHEDDIPHVIGCLKHLKGIIDKCKKEIKIIEI